jgi:beta-lactamase superfamily II metal-dependent hydrolase
MAAATQLGLGLTVLALAAAVLLWWQVFNGPDGKLHVYFFDVGQGDSALIVTPEGKQVLADGGAGSQTAALEVSGVLPRGDRSIDLVVLTHLDADHSRGLFEVLNRFQVGGILTGIDHAGSAMYLQWSAALDRGDWSRCQWSRVTASTWSPACFWKSLVHCRRGRVSHRPTSTITR